MKKLLALLMGVGIALGCFPVSVFAAPRYRWVQSGIFYVKPATNVATESWEEETSEGVDGIYTTYPGATITTTHEFQNSFVSIHSEYTAIQSHDKEDYEALGAWGESVIQTAPPNASYDPGETAEFLLTLTNTEGGSEYGAMIDSEFYVGITSDLDRLLNENGTYTSYYGECLYDGGEKNTGGGRWRNKTRQVQILFPEVSHNEEKIYLCVQLPTKIPREDDPDLCQVYKTIYEYTARSTEKPKPEPERDENDCGIRFDDIYGEVSVRPDDEVDEAYEYAELDMVLHYEDRIRTKDESGAILDMTDRSNFEIMENTIVVLPPKQSVNRLFVIIGNTWMNLKKMITGEELIMETSTATAGIKATSISVEVDPDTQETVFYQFSHGAVITNKATGEQTVLEAGQCIRVSGENMTTEPFDVQAKLEEYDPGNRKGYHDIVAQENSDGWVMPEDMLAIKEQRTPVPEKSETPSSGGGGHNLSLSDQLDEIAGTQNGSISEKPEQPEKPEKPPASHGNADNPYYRPREETGGRRLGSMDTGEMILYAAIGLVILAAIAAVISGCRGSRKNRRPPPPPPPSGTNGFVNFSQKPSVQNENPAGFCPQCGQPVQPGTRFCSHCGAKIESN